MNEAFKVSLLEMARGGFLERVDYEMAKVIDNILDPNTKATAKRRITITMDLTPDDSRQNVAVKFVAKPTLAETYPLTTSLCIVGEDGTGEVCVVEMVPQIPGQLDMDGSAQERPPQLKIIRSA